MYKPDKTNAVLKHIDGSDINNKTSGASGAKELPSDVNKEDDKYEEQDPYVDENLSLIYPNNNIRFLTQKPNNFL